MAELLAGISSGFLMGVIFVGLGALLVIPSRPIGATPVPADEGKTISKKLSMGLPFIAISVWGFGLGPLFGLSLLIFKRALPAGGLGSSNLAYTLSILFLAGLFTIAVLVLQRSRLKEKMTLIICFAAIFGWLLPLLAS